MTFKNIAFLSFIPDTGHIMPLLRIAYTLKEYKYNVICYFPEECRNLSNNFKIPFKSLGRVSEIVDDDVFIRTSKRTIFYNAFSYYNDIYISYIQPIDNLFKNKLKDIIELLKYNKPDVIIADENHIYNKSYKFIANQLNITIIIHNSEGNLRYMSNLFIFNYGMNNYPLIVQHFFEMIVKFQNFIRYHKRNKPAIKKDFLFNKKNNNKIIYISTGLALIEKIINDKYKKIINNEKYQEKYIHFPVVKDKRDIKLPEKLKFWLDNSNDKPVIYISLGTKIQPDKKFIQKIIKGLKSLNVKILLVIPKKQRNHLKEYNNEQNILIEEFIPQSLVLLHKNIRCFITHGGAGGIQESLLAGKPMLCIPFMFDQPYNSSIICKLKAGIRLNKNKVTPRSIKKSMKKLLYDPCYRNSAQSIMLKLKEIDGGKSLINYLTKTLDITN